MGTVTAILSKRNRPMWDSGLEAIGDEVEMAAVSLVEIPLLGWVSAGQPVDICESQEQVSVPSNMVKRNCYALKVRGHSMIDDNIEDGDIIVIEKRETAENGQSVIAMINGEHVTLKRFYVERDGIRLQPANPDMQPIYLRNEEVQILGIVAGVIRHSS